MDIRYQKIQISNAISYDAAQLCTWWNDGEVMAHAGFHNGLGKVILSLFIRELFSQYGISKIILDTNLKNTRAQHVYEQLGFHKIGVEMDSWWDQLGQLQSAVLYELTPENVISYIPNEV